MMGTLLGGCSEKLDPVYIDEWLDNAQRPSESNNPSLFSYDDEEDGYYHFTEDYGLVIAEDIREAVQDVKAKSAGSKLKVVGSLPMEYRISAYVGDFSMCQIYIHDNGILESRALREKNEFGKTSTTYQYFRYDIGKEKVATLYNKFKNRRTEIMEGKAQENEECTNKVSIENFLEHIDNFEGTRYISYMYRRNNGGDITHVIQDLDFSYINAIKEFGFTKIDGSVGETLPKATYYVDDEWALIIPEEPGDKVAVRYINVNSRYREYSLFSQKWYYAYYSVDATKVSALLERFNEIR